jgi:hypothetical protein
VIFITAFLDRLHRGVLDAIDVFLALSENPSKIIHEFCDLIDAPHCELGPPADGEEHHAAIWWKDRGAPFWLERIAPKSEHLRHQRSYLDGEMEEDMRFYFRGPENELNLGVQNLRMFMQIAEGVDDATWEYHLRRGDYSNWFREVILDDDLAALAIRLGKDRNLSAKESREQLAKFILEKYDV